MVSLPAISFETCRPLEAHARQVMAWRNDPTTLSVSFHREPKQWDLFWPEYRDVYCGVAGSLAPVFALADGRRVGFLRFQPAPHPQNLAGRTVDISVNLDPQARGRGLGTEVLKAAMTYLAGRGVDCIYAEVRSGNEASLKVFTKAGFSPIGAAEKTIADTGETCTIERFTTELTADFWRKRPVYVIAEAGSNWRSAGDRNDTAQARSLIDVAVKAGADAVKFQVYRANQVYVANAGQVDYLSDAGITEDIIATFENLAMPYEMISELAAYCAERGIDFMSTPFSPADFAAIDPFVAVHKIASYEISHVHLIKLAARSGKPLVLSTGASNAEDIAWAVDTYRGEGGRDLCLLQCTAKYPAPIDSLNLRTIPWLRERFGVAAGLSDHGSDPATGPAVAVALGARVIEKHFTLDKNLPGPDHAFALEPSELEQLVSAVRAAEQSLGDGIKQVLPDERELAAYARRGLQATADIAVGDLLRENVNFAVLRPGKQSLGCHSRHLERFENRRINRAVRVGEGLRPGDVDE